MNDGSPQHESQQILSAFRRILRRRKLVIALSLAAVLVPIVYYNQTTSPLYEASTSLVFEEVSSPISEDVFKRTSTEQYLMNRLEEINSRAFAGDLAQALPHRMWPRFRFSQEPLGKAERLQRMGDVIHESLFAYPVRNSNIFRIRVRMSDPKLCVSVADLSVQALQDREYRIHRRGVTELRTFIERQLELYGAQLKKAEQDLKAFQEKSGVTSIDSESREVLRKMTEAEVLYNATQARRGAAKEKLAAIQQALAAERKDLVPGLTNIASPSAQRLKDRLIDLQTQYAQLMAQSYPQDHPQILSLQQDVEQTKKALISEAIKLSAEDRVGDPIAKIERYVNESLTLQIEIESMKALESALMQTLDGYRAYLGRLPAKEMELARSIRERDASQKIYTSLLERREEVRMSEAKQIPNSRVIDQAQLPKDPIKPRRALNLAVGAVMGLILGSGIGLLLESGSKDLGSTLDFEREIGWSVLALVPSTKVGPSWWSAIGRLARGIPTKSKSGRLTVAAVNPESAAGESYLMLRTRLELLGVGTRHRTLLVTSSWPGEGKSWTLSNLAVAFGADGRSALVVDAELRRPVLHEIFGVQSAPGLRDLLMTRYGNGNLPEGVSDRGNGDAGEKESESRHLFQATGAAGVSVLACGEWVENQRRELSKSDTRELLADLRRQYDVVLVDSASPFLVHDTLKLCGAVDAVIVVVDARTYDPSRLIEMRRLLESAGANVVGAVVNWVDLGPKYGSYYSRKP